MKPWHVRHEPSLLQRGLSAGSHTPLPQWFTHCLVPSPASADPGSVSRYRPGNETAKCPESLCPTSVLPPLGRRDPPPRRALPLRHRSYGLMRQTRPALPSFGFCLVRGVFAGYYQPLLPAGSSRRYLCESFLRCLGPYHDGLQVACTCYFPCNIGLPQSKDGSAYREIPLKRLHSGGIFEVAAISLCSGLSVCLPPWSLPPLQFPAERFVTFTSEHVMLRCLRMPRIC